MNRLGKYQLVAQIARGGMGIVYLAVTRGPARFSKLLVLKELMPALAEDEAFREMFLEEARLAARLSHPNIVQTYDIGEDGGRYYMVMDYLDGVSLSRVLRKKDSRFTLPMRLRVVCEALRGLQYAHALADFDGTPLGLVHRDVNPQNLFITFDGQVKLVDFGIAKARDSSIETRAGVFKGKPAYMAPEQISGAIDTRADLFAAGVIIWECVADRRMWHKKGDVDVFAAVMNGDLPSLREAAPDAHEELLRICDKATAVDRAKRYQTADALRADIEAYLESSGTNVQMPAVSAVAAEIFADERAERRAQIDRCVAKAMTSREDSVPPMMAPGGEPPSMDGSERGLQETTTGNPVRDGCGSQRDCTLITTAESTWGRAVRRCGRRGRAVRREG